ncbi:MAG TPA: alpha/beta hydrolase [Gemmatirosa sp.]
MQSPDERAAIAAMGRELGPHVLHAVYARYRPEQERLAAVQPVTAADLPYGDHPRQTLDLYAPQGVQASAPVFVWVHGGGFLRGEKRAPDHPFNAHVGRWAARHGMLGAVMNYRLAPDATWPSGGEDVAAVVAWLRAHAAAYGGDAARIVLAGTSAGAVHVATALRLQPGIPVRAAVLLSGLYGFTSLDERDTLYYGAQAHDAERNPREAVVNTTLPLFVGCAEFDPSRFQAEALGLLAARLERHGRLPRAYIASGHNHFSLAYHLGGTDTRLGAEILGVVRDACGE